MLELEDLSDYRRQGLNHLSKCWLTITMKEKSIKFILDTGTQHLVLTEAHGKNHQTKSHGYRRPQASNTQRIMDFEMGWVSYIFLDMPGCYLGKDSLTIIRTQIMFDPKEKFVTGQDGRPI